jgi:HlyD family type I secretion membrane fusion protein
MQQETEQSKKRLGAAGGPLFIGYLTLVILIGVLGVWSVKARIAGAVIASGMIQVENNRQVLQHPEGGVVGALLARDGDRVEAGDVVLRLDDKLLRSELAIIRNQLNELRARKGRLIAERDEADSVTFDPLLVAQDGGGGEVTSLMEGQSRLFEARRLSLRQETTQIENQIGQTGDQIDGSLAQLEASESQTSFLVSELEDVQSLFDKGLAQASRLSALRREEARLVGEIGQIRATIAQLKGDIARLEIEKLRLKSSRREEAIGGLRDLSAQEIELAERELATQDTLSKMELRTPVSGVIYGSRVFALQSVISPAEPIMFVIPQDQPLIVSARIESIHIDQVHVGQDAALRFSAFDQRTTPEIFGTVSKLSADVFTDETTGQSYYQAELLPKPEELIKLEGQTLLPGMPVETFIKTAERSPLSYLLKPLMDYFNKAFREV